jgi:hypothetical protein
MPIAYEHLLDQDRNWALSEGSRHFEGKSAVQEALRKITRRLEDLGIPYAVAGGMALFRHGFRRFTEDVDILVTPEGLKQIHAELEGRGYVPPFTRSKNLRDTEFGVRIEFLVAGQYPGDGKPKPVAFPDPAEVGVEIEGIRFLSLPALIELKLASGMTNPDRMKDLTDVLELIKLLGLPRELGSGLNAFVRDKYHELWDSTRKIKKRYLTVWRNEFLTTGAKNLDDMIKSLRRAVEALEAMRADGVMMDPGGGRPDGEVYLVTSDPDIAKKYDMHEESEFFGGDVEEEGR